jgi:hypothetical protein
MKKILFSTYCFLCVSCVFGQSANQKVFAAGGQSAGQFAYTIGEPFTNTLVLGNQTITQGFHQTRLTIVSTENTSDFISIKLLPNPTSDFITLTVEGYDTPLNIQILDIQGRIVINKEAVSGEKFFVADLPQGTYFVITQTIDNKILNRTKFIKL